MSQSDGRQPPVPPMPLGHRPTGWDDWDPDAAHRGYTGHMGAVGGILRAPDPGASLPGTSPQPALPPLRPRGTDPLGPAGLAASVRAHTEDYLTIEYNLDDPGFVELYDAVILPQWSEPFGRLLLSVFLTQTRSPGWHVIDVACGTGYPTIELARFLGQDCDVVGLDIWEAAIRRAREKAGDEWLRNVSFHVGDLLASGLPSGGFDLVTCNLGLPSFADRRAALGAMARLLHPGGRLLITLPLQAAMREFLDTYYLTLRDLKLTDFMQQLARHIQTRPTAAEVRSLVESTGFAVERAVTDAFTLRFPDARAFLTSPVIQTNFMAMWRGLIPDPTVRRLVFNEVERRLQARAYANGGELTMTVPMLCVAATRL